MQSEEEINGILKRLAESLGELYGKSYYVIFLTSTNQYVYYHNLITTIFEDWLFPYGEEKTIKNCLSYRLEGHDNDNIPIIMIEFPEWYVDPYINVLQIDKDKFTRIMVNFIDKLEPVCYEP